MEIVSVIGLMVAFCMWMIICFVLLDIDEEDK